MKYLTILLFIAMTSIACRGAETKAAAAADAPKAAAAASAPAPVSGTVSVPNASPVPAAAAVEPVKTSADTPTTADPKPAAAATTTKANAKASSVNTNSDPKGTGDTKKEVKSGSLPEILKTTEAIVSMIVALIIAITTAVLKWRSTGAARSALQTVVDKVEVAKADSAGQVTAKRISKAVSEALPAGKSAAGSLIHAYAKAAEEKVGIKA